MLMEFHKFHLVGTKNRVAEGWGRVVLREETGEGDRDLVPEGLPYRPEQFVPYK